MPPGLHVPGMKLIHTIIFFLKNHEEIGPLWKVPWSLHIFTAQDHPEVQGAKVHETEPEEACLGSPGEVAKPPIDQCNLYHNQRPSWGPLRSRKLTVPSNVSRDVLYGKILSAFMNPPL